MKTECIHGHELTEANTYTYSSGRRSCRECHRARGRAWKTANKEKHRVSQRASELKHKYNMTLEDYDLMSADQNHVCAICYKPDPAGRRLAVDHNHETGKIRGLLCHTCNRAIGLLRDDRTLLSRASEYLGKSEEFENGGGI